MTHHLTTRLVHAGEHPRAGAPAGNAYTPTSMPIHASSTFFYNTAEELDAAFERGGDAMNYARHGNPTTNALEAVMVDIEGGRGAVATASGMSALYLALLAAGTPRGATEPHPRHILASSDLYGATTKILKTMFAAQGVSVTFCDMTRLDEVQSKIDALEPDVLLLEAISNPLLKVADISAISQMAHEVDARVVVDATMATPVLCQPLALGADISAHSATKYLAGHGDVIGGVLVAKGGLVADTAHAYAALIGPTLGPFEAKLITRGVKTLALRMERQCANALKIAQALNGHSAIKQVIYPGLPSHPQHALAARQFGGKFGGMISLELAAGTREAAIACMNKLKLALPATSLGDIYTLVTYPPISSHRELDAEQRRNVGIGDGLLRFSIGIEDADDILADIVQAL